ncbi:protein ACCELERATED CELL DEATH 6-like [Quercus lobata]|uniref:Ankyrin repeat-containing protein n=1 Tax=Quercus lobata TaxID=97700 RepID=A0A7N2L558_QUELO|nr:protein ACCELERATED CELL DEATH 6-like [Quercus lobata]
MEEGRQYTMNPDVYRAASIGNSSFFEKLTDPSTLLQLTTEKNTVLHVALQFEKFNIVEELVRLRPSLVHEKNSKGNTPLHVAVRWTGASSTVKLIIQKAKDQRDVEAGGQQLLSMVNEDGDPALQVAVQYDSDDEFEIVRELMKEDPKLAKHVNNAGESALFLAMDRENYKMARYIPSAALDNCSYAGRHGMNILHALVLHTNCCKCCSIQPAS